MEAPSDGNENPEETPNPIAKKGSRKRKNNSQTDTSSEENTDTPGDSSQDILGEPETLETRDITTNSMGATDNAYRLTTESQSSGYTTERSSSTTIRYEPLIQNSSSYSSIETLYGPPPMNVLREIHVEINPSSSEDEIQSVRRDLQELLTNALFHIGRWNNQAIYIIAYTYM